MTFCVGLTGGIGCGKTRATEMFEALGAGVVDTDIISRELTAAGGGAMPDIEREFGAEYLAADGSLDRGRMRALVFSDPGARSRLEAILHPRIRAATRERIAHARTPYVLIVVPLLFETGAYRELIDRVLVVDCDEAQQVSRVVARSGIAEDEVRRIMKAQLPRAERIARADDVLVNDGDINTLREHVEKLHARYVAEALEKGPNA